MSIDHRSRISHGVLACAALVLMAPACATETSSSAPTLVRIGSQIVPVGDVPLPSSQTPDIDIDPADAAPAEFVSALERIESWERIDLEHADAAITAKSDVGSLSQWAPEPDLYISPGEFYAELSNTCRDEPPETEGPIGARLLEVTDVTAAGYSATMLSLYEGEVVEFPPANVSDYECSRLGILHFCGYEEAIDFSEFLPADAILETKATMVTLWPPFGNGIQVGRFEIDCSGEDCDAPFLPITQIAPNGLPCTTTERLQWVPFEG